jgi:hypothetical protein
MKKFMKNLKSLNKKPRNIENPIIWWKDLNLFIGIIFVIGSFILGLYGKAILISKVFDPIRALTGISIWAFSWFVLFVGISIVGWETVRIIKYKIKHKVHKTVKRTYTRAKKIHSKSHKYAKKLHNSNINKIAKMSKKEHDAINLK